MSAHADMTVSEYKARVSRWANEFAPHLRSTCWAIGALQNKDNPDRFITAEAIQHEIRTRKFKRGDKADSYVPSVKTIRSRHMVELRRAGAVVSSERQRYKHPKSGKLVWGGSIHVPNFTVVLTEAGVVEHEFMAPLETTEKAVNSAEVEAPQLVTAGGGPRKGHGRATVRTTEGPPDRSPNRSPLGRSNESHHNVRAGEVSSGKRTRGYGRRKPARDTLGIPLAALDAEYGDKAVTIAVNALELDWDDAGRPGTLAKYLTTVGGEPALREKIEEVRRIKRWH